MLRSLVGSEMCIRDSPLNHASKNDWTHVLTKSFPQVTAIISGTRFDHGAAPRDRPVPHGQVTVEHRDLRDRRDESSPCNQAMMIDQQYCDHDSPQRVKKTPPTHTKHTLAKFFICNCASKSYSVRGFRGRLLQFVHSDSCIAVSYTHLTLPTILRV